MVRIISLLALAHSAAGLRTSSLATRPRVQALKQIREEEQLLQGFRMEQEPPAAPNVDSHPILDPLGALESGDVSGVCDVVASGPVCFSDRQRVVLPNAVQPGLVAHYTFDEQSAYDASGNGNHGVNQVLHGPAPFGVGHSGAFARNFITVPDSVQFHTPDFSYTFWAYLNNPGSSTLTADDPDYCPLLRKGIHEDATKQYASAPSILLSRSSGKIRVSLTTAAGSGGHDGEFLDSNGRLLQHRWMHIGVVRTGKFVSIYLNGILDASAQTHGASVSNEYPLYIGGDPFTANQCDSSFLLDEVRVYSHAVQAREIAAEAAPALGGADPSLVRLGCSGCNLEQAVKSCASGRHVCTSLELHTGGYQTARGLGWLVPGTHVFTYSAVEAATQAQQAGQPMPAAQQAGLGLCCSGSTA
jgi:hypothetical protein